MLIKLSKLAAFVLSVKTILLSYILRQTAERHKVIAVLYKLIVMKFLMVPLSDPLMYIRDSHVS